MSKCKILLRANLNISFRFLQSLFVRTIQIAGQSGFDRGDTRDFAYKFAKSMVNHLKFGDYVQLGINKPTDTPSNLPRKQGEL